MAKISVDVNVREIIGRIIKAAHLKNVAELAARLNLSPQSLSNSMERGSISLSLLLRGQEIAVSPVTLDYLVHDEEEPEEGDYITISRINGGKPVSVLKELLRQGLDKGKLRTYIESQNLFVIDTSDINVISGNFAFGDPKRPAIRSCILQMSGMVLVEGEPLPLNLEELNQLGVVGRVVLRTV